MYHTDWTRTMEKSEMTYNLHVFEHQQDATSGEEILYMTSGNRWQSKCRYNKMWTVITQNYFQTCKWGGIWKKWIPYLDLGLISEESYYVDEAPTLGRKPNQTNNKNNKNQLWNTFGPEHVWLCYHQVLECGTREGLLKYRITSFILASKRHWE